MENKDAKLGLGSIRSDPLAGKLDVLLKLLDGILERRPGVVDLVHNQDSLADEVRHLAQGGEVEPLGAGDLCANLLDLGVVAQGLVQGEADGLDGDVGRAGALEERAQDSRGHVAAAADGDDELRLEVIEDLGSGLLAQLVDVVVGNVELLNHLDGILFRYFSKKRGGVSKKRKLEQVLSR